MTAALEDFGAAEHAAVAVAAGGAAWEAGLLDQLADPRSGLVVLKRCLDVADLLAFAGTGAVRLAVVAEQLPGLDADALARLCELGVRVVAVSPGGWGPSRLHHLGVDTVLSADEVSEGASIRLRAVLASLPESSAAALERAALPQTAPQAADALVLPQGRLVAVWGPHGSAGRTTVAVGVAAELARAGAATLLLDADPYGGAVSQHLGVIEEVSGLLSAARLANAGELPADRLAALARTVSEGLTVLTGLPRPDRWTELRPAALEVLLEAARGAAEVTVVDAGFGLVGGADAGPGRSREDVSGAAVLAADQVVAVAAADPVGLTRLARSLAELRELRPEGPEVVVVNRMRPGLGWSQQDVATLVGGLAPRARVRFLPEDRAAADRALVWGRTLAECGDSALRRGLAALATDVLELADLVPTPSGAGRARRR